MNWLDTITYILYGCGVLIILLFAVNLILAKKRGEDSPPSSAPSGPRPSIPKRFSSPICS